MSTRPQLDGQLADRSSATADAQTCTDEARQRLERDHAASSQAPFGWRNQWAHHE